MKKYFLSLLILVAVGIQLNAQQERAVWTKEKANAWYANYGWLCGSDFIPAIIKKKQRWFVCHVYLQ